METSDKKKLERCEEWKPVCEKEYIPGEPYGTPGYNKNRWRMARVEDGKNIVREMKWYERLYYWKGLPLEIEAWGAVAWLSFTFVACLLLVVILEGHALLDLDIMFFQVARFILFLGLLCGGLRLIREFIFGYFVRRKNRPVGRF